MQGLYHYNIERIQEEDALRFFAGVRNPISEAHPFGKLLIDKLMMKNGIFSLFVAFYGLDDPTSLLALSTVITFTSCLFLYLSFPSGHFQQLKLPLWV